MAIPFPLRLSPFACSLLVLEAAVAGNRKTELRAWKQELEYQRSVGFCDGRVVVGESIGVKNVVVTNTLDGGVGS